MIVADTATLVSLATIETLGPFLDEFDVHTTDTALDELDETAAYDDGHAVAAGIVLDRQSGLTVHSVESPTFESSRIDVGEATCARLTGDPDADFFVTDDFRALPELRSVVDGEVAISSIVLKPLVQRGRLTRRVAEERVESLAENRDWLGSPIYRRAKELFE